MARIRTWAARTTSGDRMENTDIAEDAAIWPLVTSTTDNCLGSKCEHFDSCWLFKARRRAMEADLVVVNHALLMADMAVRNEGFGEVLPGAHVFVIDEAHQLPETASNHFGSHCSARQLTDLARDTLMEASSQSGALKSVQAAVEALQLSVKKLRLALDGLPVKGALDTIEGDPQVSEGLDEVQSALTDLRPVLEGLAKASEGLGNCAERVVGLVALLDTLRSGADRSLVRWYELSSHGFALHATPLDVSGPLSEYRTKTGASWILTSATLAVGERFSHFQRETGMLDARTLKVDSPFDYRSQALLYLPQGLPEPSDPGYVGAVVRAAVPMLKASRGRAFFLFTSHRALRDAAAQLTSELDFPLFVQGTAPRGELLRQFIASGNGILLGAASFWEGVDVPGDALSLVIIDKLPFAQIGDPVMEARLQAVRDNGGNPFNDYQLPGAVLALKQGSGRLIRTVRDRGVLMLCDPRLNTKAYGRTFLDSLPKMPRTRDPVAAAAFFDMHA
jgi:ATP-dependent DNA helicase DinG